MRPPGALGVLWGLLALTGGALAMGILAEACPPGCECSDSAPIELSCRRAPGAALVTFEGERTRYLNVHCLQKDTKDFTCEDIPEFDFGRNGSLEGLSFHGCPLASLSIACVARRVRAREVLNLTVYDPPGGPQLLPRNVEGLAGVRRLFLRGREERDEPVSLPSAALASLPSLERLTLTSARVQLSPGALSGLPALTRLELSMARLRSLPAGALAALPALTQLSLFRNDIENITADSFQDLAALEVLDVSSNQLSALDGGALAAGCPRLRALHAYNNPLRALRPLRPLRRLQELEIFDCDLEHPLELSAGALAALPHLQHATVRACLIQSLPEDLLTNSTDLLTLDLSDNSLRELPAKVFADQRKLTDLDLSGNQLESLPQEVFWSLSALRQLKLDKNRLVELPDRFVEGLPLVALSAGGNRLRRLRGGTLAGAGALHHLDLSNNQLENAPADGQYYNLEQASPFNSLLRLRTLDLSHNALSALYADVAPALLALMTLDMSHNNISYITDLDNSLSFLSANVTVDLRHNNISLVELSPAPWRAQVSPGYASRVLLDDNPLRCDCRLYALARRVKGYAGAATLPAMEAGDAVCAAPPSLRGRRFADVNPYDLACDIPADLCVPSCTCVRHPLTIALDCTEQFSSLPQQFDKFPLELKLRYAPSSLSWIPSAVLKLDLSDLNMTVLPIDFNVSTIEDLDLRGNRLTEIPIEVLEANLTVRVSRNPLACDCWHAAAVRRLQAARMRVADYEEVTCVGGSPARNVDAERLCRTLAMAVGGALLALLGLASAVAAVLLLRYSLHLKVFLYARGWCGCWVREEDLDKDKKFDAFVSFAHQDERFVQEILRPGLEGGPRPFKLCIHDRDWIAGEWIPAQIAESVEQSRRTIVVLSRNFLESKWGRLEFRAANMSAVEEKRARVIVVLLEDIENHDQLDTELKAYLATNTYLKWGDPWFWEKLRYALPHRAEEVRMRKQGGRLARLMQGASDKGKGGDSPLDVQFTPNGKIVTAAIKAPPDLKIPSAVKTPQIQAAGYI